MDGGTGGRRVLEGGWMGVLEGVERRMGLLYGLYDIVNNHLCKFS